MSIMGLTKGLVTPFGLLNDEEKRVQFYIREELVDGKFGIYPNENTATVWMQTKNLIKIVKEHRNSATVF